MKAIKILTISALALFVTLSSCEKDDEYTPEAMTKATIKGRVEANLNTTNTGDEFAPTGTKIIAVINAADLSNDPVPGYNYKDMTFETTVDANGNYEFKIYANTKNVNVTIMAEDFIYDQVIPEGTGTTTQRKVFVAGNQFTTVIKNTTKVVDLFYN
jgi:hypothetical protein